MGIFDQYNDLLGKKEAEKKESKQSSSKKEQKEKKPEARRDSSQKSSRQLAFSPLLSFLKLGMMIKKDFKLLIRSKTSALIVLLGPLAIILLVGLAFNSSSLYNLRVATYSESYSELSNSVITSLQDQQYSVVKVDSIELCKSGVKFGDYHLCVIFPKDLSIGSQDNTIEIHVDQSRMNLASLITTTITQKVAAKSNELGIGLTTDLLTVFENTKKSIDEKVVTVNKIISGDSDAALKIKESEESLGMMNLTVEESDFNFTDVKAKIKDITDKFNVSETLVNRLKNSVGDLEISVDLLNERLSEASSAKANAVQNLGDTRNTLSSTMSDLNALRAALNGIVTDINSIKVTQAGLIVEPIKTSVQPITQEKKHLSFLFPTMVVLVIMFISILLSSTIVIREKISLAYFRNFITPTSEILYMLGTYLTNIIIVLLQLCILFAVAAYFMKDQLISIAANLALVILVISSVFILIGMLIGYIFRTEETSTLAAISVSSILLFFSNTILPIESLPTVARDIIKYNPFVLSESLVKKILLFNADISILANSICILLSFVAVLFIMSYIARELTKRSI